MEWELYHNSFSLCSKKVRVCMAELGLDYRSHPIDLIETGRYQNVSRAFLAVNPAGTVPVLVHRGRTVYESHEQIVYAAAHAGARGRTLLPEDPATRALVQTWVDCASLVGDDPTRGTELRAGHCVPGLTVPIFAAMVRYIPYRKILFGLLFHPHKQRPLVFATLKARGIHRLPGLAPAMALLARSREHMGGHLDALGAQLLRSGGPWIAGADFTLADVSWVVILDRLAEVDWDEHFWGGGRRPAVAAYWQRLRERPSFELAIESQRCENTRKGIADVKRAKRDDPALRAALEGAG
jgi:glutathione S-transferase